MADRRVQPVPDRHGHHIEGTLGGLGRVVSGPGVLRQTTLAGESRGRGPLADERQAAPAVLHNASEFKSAALRRGCEQHGIELTYRPGGQPHYGGIVERVIGTAMTKVHELPGTTFSDPADRGSYPSEKKAALTLRELERWLVLVVATYHSSTHRGLGQTQQGGGPKGSQKMGIRR